MPDRNTIFGINKQLIQKHACNYLFKRSTMKFDLYNIKNIDGKFKRLDLTILLL